MQQYICTICTGPFHFGKKCSSRTIPFLNMLSTRSILIVQIKSHLQQENKGQYSYMPLSSIQFSGCTSILVGAQKIQRLHKLIHASINTKKKLHPPKFSPPINIHQKFIPIQPSIHLTSHSSSINFITFIMHQFISHHIHHTSILQNGEEEQRRGCTSASRHGSPWSPGAAATAVARRRKRRRSWSRRRRRGPGGSDDS